MKIPYAQDTVDQTKHRRFSTTSLAALGTSWAIQVKPIIFPYTVIQTYTSLSVTSSRSCHNKSPFNRLKTSSHSTMVFAKAFCPLSILWARLVFGCVITLVLPPGCLLARMTDERGRNRTRPNQEGKEWAFVCGYISRQFFVPSSYDFTKLGVGFFVLCMVVILNSMKVMQPCYCKDALLSPLLSMVLSLTAI